MVKEVKFTKALDVHGGEGRPEFSGCITSVTRKPPPEPQPDRRPTIGESVLGTMHAISSDDISKAICGQVLVSQLKHIRLEHWGTAGASWCIKCAERLGWA